MRAVVDVKSDITPPVSRLCRIHVGNMAGKPRLCECPHCTAGRPAGNVLPYSEWYYHQKRARIEEARRWNEEGQAALRAREAAKAEAAQALRAAKATQAIQTAAADTDAAITATVKADDPPGVSAMNEGSAHDQSQGDHTGRDVLNPDREAGSGDDARKPEVLQHEK